MEVENTAPSAEFLPEAAAPRIEAKSAEKTAMAKRSNEKINGKDKVENASLRSARKKASRKKSNETAMRKPSLEGNVELKASDEDNTQKSKRKKVVKMNLGSVENRMSQEQKTQEDITVDELVANTQGSVDSVKSPKNKSDMDDSIYAPSIMDSVELFALATADLKRTHQKTFVGEDNRIQPEPWSWRDWKDLAVLAAMMAVLMDPLQNMGLAWISRKAGGLYYPLVYAILVTVCQLPLLQLYAHVGHYHRTGLLKVFGLYGPIYKVIGICALLTLTIHMGNNLNQLTGEFVLSSFGGYNASAMVSCEGKEYNCYGNNSELETCCYSLFDRRLCEEGKTGEWCAAGRLVAPNRQAASAVFITEIFKKVNYKMFSIPVVFVSLVAVVAILAAFTPPYIFLIGVASIGLIGLLMRIVQGLILYILGDLGAGLRREWSQSLIMKFEVPSWSYVVATLLWTGLSKVSVISLASMVSPQKRLYYPIIIMHFVHVSITAFNYFSELAMIGFLEKSAKEWRESSSVASAKTHEHFTVGVIAEFFALNGLDGCYIFSKLMMLVVAIGPLSAIFIDVISATTDGKTTRRWLRIAGCALVFGVLCLASSVLMIFSSVNRFYTMSSIVMLCALIMFIVECTIRLYGSNEHIVDVSALYPIKNMWDELTGPTSPFYSYCLCRILPLVLMATIVAMLQQMISTHRKSMEGIFLMSIGLPLFLAPFIIGFVVELVILKRNHLSLWRAFMPTRTHRAYKRFFSNESEDLLKPTSSEIMGRASEELPVDPTQDSESPTSLSRKSHENLTTAEAFVKSPDEEDEKKLSARSTQPSEDAKRSLSPEAETPPKKKSAVEVTATENSPPKKLVVKKSSEQQVHVVIKSSEREAPENVGNDN